MTKQLVSLKVKCPSCQQSLMDYTHFLNAKPSIKLTIECGGKHGVINLCSTYGCYDKTSNIPLVEHDIARLFCTHCKKELPSLAKCDVCGAPLVSFALEKGGKVHVCSRIGCKKHAVSFEDIYTTLTTFYEEDLYGARDTDF
jgi:hypothetical protein